MLRDRSITATGQRKIFAQSAVLHIVSERRGGSSYSIRYILKRGHEGVFYRYVCPILPSELYIIQLSLRSYC